MGAGNDLTATVFSNTAIQQFFALRDRQGIEELVALSGKTLDTTTAETYGQGPNGATYSRTTQEQVVNRYESSDILMASAAPDQFLMRVNTNEGLAAWDGFPFVARCPFHVTEDTYKKRVTFPWPEKTPDTLVVGAMDQPAEAKQEAPTQSVPTPPADGPIITSGSFGGAFSGGDKQ